MRHDPASAAIVVMLRGLKMYGMAQAVGDLSEQGAPAFAAAVPVLSQLLKAEVGEREVRSIAYQIKAARFPAYKDLAGFDFSSSEVNEAMVRQLHQGEYIVGADNVVLIGGPGTGKTHIAAALGLLGYRLVPRMPRPAGAPACDYRVARGTRPGTDPGSDRSKSIRSRRTGTTSSAWRCRSRMRSCAIRDAQKATGFKRQNRLDLALAEVGQIERTLFTLNRLEAPSYVSVVKPA